MRFCSSRKEAPSRCQRRKYNPGKKASKRKCTSDVKTADPKPSTSQDKSTSTQQPQDEPASEQQPQDESVPEQQPQDGSVSEQQQDAPAAEQQQDKASDTLTSQSSDDSILPDYGAVLKTFTTKIPVLYQRNRDIVFDRKHNIFNPFCLIFSLQITRNSSYMLENSCIVNKCHMCQKFFRFSNCQSYTCSNVFLLSLFSTN